MGDVILFKEDVDQLNSLLKNLVDDSKILSALLITTDTRVLACQGTLCSTDTSALAALIVGSFASTQAIASLIGETGFETLSHCGKTRNVLISLIDNDTILASIFDKSSTNDRIQTCVQKHLEVLRKALRSIGNNTTHDLFDAAGQSASGGSDAGDEFELRADALSKASQSEEREAPPPHPAQRTERGQRTAPATVAHGGIKRPPDTETITIEPTHYPSGDLPFNSHATPTGRAKEAADGALRKLEKQPSSNEQKERVHENDSHSPASLAAASAPDAKSHEDGATLPDTVHMSMNYLKNKTREGALYYHYDKTFFKKFFKSSNKKKT
jgi:predicted regulator of Ras-like GTPase activity (Roadblock/LC7/MglB family)